MIHDMEEFQEMFSGWSWEENKQFELALAVVDEGDPHRWEVVSSMLGGKKSLEDVKRHYVVLLEDLKCIESGELDHKLLHVGGESHLHQEPNCVQVDLNTTHQSLCWNEDDHELLVQLKIN